jgi:hypothetical protein
VSNDRIPKRLTANTSFTASRVAHVNCNSPPTSPLSSPTPALPRLGLSQC